MARRRDKSLERKIATERMLRLETLAASAAREHHLGRATRYVALARGIGMKYQMPVQTSFRVRACRGCGAYLVPSLSSRVRVRAGRIVTTCLACDHVTRRALKPFKRAKGGAGAPPSFRDL